MSLAEYTNLFRPKIEETLQILIDQAIPPGYDELKSMLSYHMGWEGNDGNAQGKRIRPILLLLCVEACGSPWETGLPFAAAIELIHNFSLIHDDIQDQSPTRHGRPTVWNKWGIAQAINAGDFLFTLAFQAATMRTEASHNQNILKAERVLIEACKKLTQGQFLDLRYEKAEHITLDDYWGMIEGKTAALISACTELGAIIAGADERHQKNLREFGRSLGLAFQIVDDWLGIWGDSSQTGKSTQSDLISRKKTLPVLYSLSRNGEFAQIWRGEIIKSEDLSKLAQMMINDGSQAFTQEFSEKMTSEAMNYLKTACFSKNNACMALEELAKALTCRQK
jgi:geranylgeranyl diphosphate synthase, type I